MAKRKAKDNSKKVLYILFVILSVVVAILQSKGLLPETVNPNADGRVYLHIIDVGQGSATLIQQGDEGILIDAGEADYAKRVSDYVNSCGIDELKYVVASHPHSDHIGGLPRVLETFTVGEVLMPEIYDENLPTSEVYEKLLDTIVAEEIEAYYCTVGEVYTLGDIKMEILGPVEQLSDLNNMSAVCKFSVGETDIMVLGDAETPELSRIYNYGGDFESEILVMGHHGSRTALYQPFLEQVNPLEALISCGKNNHYGHPSKETISYLTERGIDYWRTDYSGNLVYLIEENGFERITDR